MELTETAIEFIFSFALFINALLFIPQAIRIFKSKTAHDISLLTFVGFLLIQLATVFHGIIHHDYLLVIGYLLSMAACGMVVILALFYRNPRSRISDDIPFRDLIEQLPWHVYWKDKEGIMLGSNTNNWKDFGLQSLADFVGKTDYDLFPKEQADKLRQMDLGVMRSGQAQIKEEESTKADGKVALYLSYKVPLRDSHQQIIGILGVSLDITDARKKEIERLNFLENIIAEMPGHVFWKDKQGVFLGCNNQQAKTLGLPSWREVIGKTTYDMVWHGQPEAERRKQAVLIDENDQKIMASGIPQLLEEPLILPDGSTAIYLSKKTSLRNENGETVGILGVSFDITEQKKAEQELQETRHKLEGMTLVSASIAHELRTPLASLGLAAESLQKCLPDLSCVYHLAKEAHSAPIALPPDPLTLMEDVLNTMESEIRAAFTFIDMLLMNVNSSVEQEEGLFSIAECIEKTLSRYPFQRRERQRIHWDKQSDFSVKGKELLITHVLFNLLKNALHYISGVKEGKIMLWLEPGNLYNRLYFKDTGSGIPAAYLPHIFERFFSKTQYGAGVGLTFCKMVMESFGGRITCESEEGRYTQFILEFPYVQGG